MRTSAKWKILEGHQGNITCLTFDSKGNLLASYSAVDQTLQLWKVGNTGFFSTIMGGTSKSSNKIVLRTLQGIRNPHSRKTDSRHESIQQQEFNKNDSIFEQPPAASTSSHNASSQSSGSAAAGSGVNVQHHHHGNKRVNQCYVKFVMPKEKEVELQREDGLRERHKLVK